MISQLEERNEALISGLAWDLEVNVIFVSPPQTTDAVFCFWSGSNVWLVEKEMLKVLFRLSQKQMP